MRFNFTYDEHLTLFDDKISAVYSMVSGIEDSGEKRLKMIAKGSMMPKGSRATQAGNYFMELDTQETILKNLFYFNFSLYDVEMPKDASFRLIKFSDGEISLRGDGKISFSVDNGETSIKIGSPTWNLKGLLKVEIYSDSKEGIIFSVNNNEVLVENHLSEKTKVEGFFGELNEGTTLGVAYVEFMKSLPLELQGDANDVNDFYVDEDDVPQEEAPQEVVSTEEQMGAITLKQILAQFGGMSLDEFQKKDHDFNSVLKVVYLYLSKYYMTMGQTHEQIKSMAYYWTGILFTKSYEQVGYSIPNDKRYNTLEFGEINSKTATPEKLLYLVMEYPDIWMDRIIKNKKQ